MDESARVHDAAALDLDGFADGGEVIVPNYTYIASASSALYMRCSVALVDIDPRTFTLCPEAVAKAIVPGRTRAVMPVHLGGQPCDMASINAIAKEHGLAVIEDCAQAHGAICDGRPVGGLGDVGAFSFQSTKNLCSGEGGAVTSSDTATYHRAVGLMNSGRMPAGGRWEYPRVGWNYRPSEYLAALLTLRLDDLEAQTQRRTQMAEYLSERLAAIPGVIPPVIGPWCTRHAYHLYVIQVDSAQFGGRSRDEVLAALCAEGIPAAAGYRDLLSNEPGLQQLAADHPQALRVEPAPVTAAACRRSIWLLQEILLGTEDDMDDIAGALAKVQRAFSS